MMLGLFLYLSFTYLRLFFVVNITPQKNSTAMITYSAIATRNGEATNNQDHSGYSVNLSTNSATVISSKIPIKYLLLQILIHLVQTTPQHLSYWRCSAP